MSSTNKTANYELSQFVGTDIPSILSDYNGDMRKIDAGIAEVATSAGSSASAVSALAGRVTTAENNITSLNGALEVTNQRSIQNQTAITAVQGVIPSDASTENKLATSEEVSDIADEVKGINDIIPANASTSNKLATMEDVGDLGDTTNLSKMSTDGTIMGALNTLFSTTGRRKIINITGATTLGQALNQVGSEINTIRTDGAIRNGTIKIKFNGDGLLGGVWLVNIENIGNYNNFYGFDTAINEWYIFHANISTNGSNISNLHIDSNSAITNTDITSNTTVPSSAEIYY